MTSERERPGNPGRDTGAPAIRVLTSTQERFLQALFTPADTAEGIYLTGGTALAAFYLQHRRSDDLDFFTRSIDEVARAEAQLLRAAAASGLEVRRADRSDTMARFMLDGDPEVAHKLEKIDLAFDPPPYVAQPRHIDGIMVDDLLSIAVNKMAIVTRDDLKDYVDLYFVLRETSYRMEDLIPLAKQKLPGLDEWALAEKFVRARRLKALIEFQQYYMLKDVDWSDLLRFYADAADRLFALFPPRLAD